jgi:crossover junction endodeoxyribonuclease RusA
VSDRVCAFEATGTPRPQGSLTPWVSAATGKVHVSHSGGVAFARWRGIVAATARRAWDGPPLTGPVGVQMLFRLPRPDGAEAGTFTTPPDVDKLSRAVLDALSGVVYVDDAQVVRLTASKVYAARPWSEPGVVVKVEDWAEETEVGG